MRIASMSALLAAVSMPVSAQQSPGKNLTVSITATSITRAGDTVVIAYRISNSPTSREPLALFMVEAPTTGLSVQRPEPHEDWMVATRYVGQPMAIWAVLDTALVAAGKTSPNLVMRAVGVPGIVTGHFEGDKPMRHVEEDTLAAIDPMDEMIHTRVVGVVPATPGSNTLPALAQRLAALAGETCGLGWIANQGICNSLTAKLSAALAAIIRGENSAARNQVQAFLQELAAQRGKHASENAYQLLHERGDYLAGRL